MLITSPVAPLSLPVVTHTWSFFFNTLCHANPSYNTSGANEIIFVTACTKLTSNWTKDTSPNWITILVNNDSSIITETNIAAICTTRLLYEYAQSQHPSTSLFLTVAPGIAFLTVTFDNITQSSKALTRASVTLMTINRFAPSYQQHLASTVFVSLCCAFTFHNCFSTSYVWYETMGGIL